jgi:cell division protease FtsH
VGFRDLMGFMANGTADSDSDTMDDDALWRTAVHEAGHAVVACLDPLSGVPSFASVIAGQHHMGVVLPSLAQMREGAIKGDVLIRDINRQICLALAGRAAEQLLLPPDEVSATGSGGDLQRATELVIEITHCKGVPLLAADSEDWSDHLAVIDENDLKRSDADMLAQANVVLAAFYEEVLAQMEANKALLQATTQALCERRYLLADDFHELMNQYRQVSNSNLVFSSKG